MIVHCPSCNARYNLTAAQLGSTGRKLRCVKCRHEWFQAAAVEAPPVAPQPGPEPNLFDSGITQHDDIHILKPSAPHGTLQQLHGVHPMFLAGGAFFAVLFIAGIIGLTLFGDALFAEKSTTTTQTTTTALTRQPPVTITETGLVLSENIERNIVDDPMFSILLFRGRVSNTNTTAVRVAPIRVSLYNEKGILLDSFPALPKKQKLEPGETTEWICRFYNPPLEKISHFQASFTPATSGSFQ